MKKRPIYVSQYENRESGEYWYTVCANTNAENSVRSRTYPERSHAVRAARAFIDAISPVPVQFSYFSKVGRGPLIYRTERIAA